eukprot:scaffold73164_cov69-Phaeocystis_antarctica.AAC.5
MQPDLVTQLWFCPIGRASRCSAVFLRILVLHPIWTQEIGRMPTDGRKQRTPTTVVGVHVRWIARP